MHFNIQESPDHIIQTMFQKYVVDRGEPRPNTYLEAADWICKRKKYAAVLPDMSIMSIKSILPCKINAVPEAVLSDPGSFSVQKRSPYKGILIKT